MSALALIGAVFAAGSDAPLFAGGRFGMLAMESGASTRAPALEAVLGTRWAAGGWVGPAVSYRLGWRDAGGDSIGMTTYVHRLQLGVFAQAVHGRAVFGAELGGHWRVESIALHTRGETARTATRREFGAGLDVWAGLSLLERLRGSFVVGAYQRRELLDLTFGLAVDWEI